MDEVRKAEAKERKLPKATRWAMLKAADGGRLTEKQQQALTELETSGFANATVWWLKKRMRWIRKATSVRTSQWRSTHFTRYVLKCIAPDTKTLAPALTALVILEELAHLILSRWTSNHSNDRLEWLNGIFQAARTRAKSYRNVFTFMTTIYFTAAPLGELVKFYS
ncbi:hypothetical protein DFAR_210001 [Desulfarculales bacterium]